MHRTIRKMSGDMFLYLRQLRRKLFHLIQGLREWPNGIHSHQTPSEGLGSTYDKRKWGEAYYAKPDNTMTRYSK